MPQTAPLHYGVHYFRLAHQYHAEGEGEVFLNRYKEPLLTLAESLFVNGHIIESWFYYHELSKIIPIDGKHKMLFQLADSYRLKQAELDEFKKAYGEYPSEIGVAYGIILLEMAKKEETGQINIKDEFIKLLESLPSGSFGKCHLELRKTLKEGNQITPKKEKSILEKFAFKSSSPLLFQALLDEQNHICLQILIFDIKKLPEKLDEHLRKLKELIEKEMEDGERKIEEKIFRTPYAQEDEEALKNLYFKAQSTRKYLMTEESAQDETSDEIDKFTKVFTGFQGIQGTIRKANVSEDTSNPSSATIEPAMASFINSISPTFSQNTGKDKQKIIKEFKRLFSEGDQHLKRILDIDPYHYGALLRSFQLREKKASKDIYVRISTLLESDELYKDYLRRKILQDTTVFISYSSVDKLEMEALRERLTAVGVKVKVDKTDIHYSDEEIKNQISKSLRQSDFVISLVSKHSLQSDWVAFESVFIFWAEIILEAEKFLPLVLDKEIRATDFLQKLTNKISKDLKVLHEIIGNGFDLSNQQQRKMQLKSNFGKIYSKVMDKLALDYSNSEEVEENFQEILERILRVKGEVKSLKLEQQSDMAARTP